MTKHKITIGHLYPFHMNLYGDRGNIITLQKRCLWRDIDVEVLNIQPGTKPDFNNIDILFMGGGQDRGQELVVNDLLTHGPAIKDAVENFMVCLLICGAYQLFGKYFKTHDGKELPGIEVLDCWTIAGEKRLIGNLIADVRDTARNWPEPASTLVGFENHSGKTYLGSGVNPVGKVISGYGNNGEDRTEGAFYKHCFGTYMHGSLLPKNPRLADYLILSALKKKYGHEIESLSKIDDSLEMLAHENAIQRSKEKTL